MPDRQDVERPLMRAHRKFYVVAKIGFRSSVVVGLGAEHEYTPAEYRSLRWKIDLCLLPLMWICYGTQQADKTGTSVMSVFGIGKDTHMIGQDFSWLTTIFYISYLVAEAPGNYLVQKLRVGRFIGTVMTFWGIIVLCIGVTHTWAELMVLRALQGIAECTISPTFLFITGTFYTAQEHTLRAVIWGTSNAGMNVISGLIEYAIGGAADAHSGGLRAWRGIAFFLGGLTIVLGVLAFLFLGTPSEVPWLSEREKRMAAARVVANQTGSDRQKHAEWKWSQVRIALRDPQTHFFFFTSLVNAMPNGGTTTFGNLVYESFGFTSKETLIKGTIPQHAVSIVYFLVAGFTCYRWKNLRFYWMMLSLLPAFAGMLALALMDKKSHLWTQWGLYLMTVTGDLPGLLFSTLLPSNVAGRTKKSVTATLLFVSYCAGNAVGVQLFQAKDAPKYIPGLTGCAVLYALQLTLMIFWRAWYSYINKKRDIMVGQMGLTSEEAERAGKLAAEEDMTDFENVHFRYHM
ncbi:MFS general substrate transporter [Teratosphaeria nubilosa]|uniref:MFS general substrate transporter n=1 Tax=Teratosphaeria nubilosa TaxID=161662 RepID=A0A6G1LCF0_9PEZI|nr:MFS general substrate transporter [Teratosphaeria nubilosa]